MTIKKVRIGAAIMATCMMLLGTGLPMNTAYADTTENADVTQIDDEYNEEYMAFVEEWHESFFFYNYYEDIKVTVTWGEDIKDYPYILMSDEIYPTAKYMVEDSTGRILRGIICKVDGNYMCSDDDGIIVTRRWMETQKGWMYFDENGYALTSQWIYLGHNWYYLDDMGIMQTGWTKVGNTWYYMDEKTGAMKIGWIRYGWDWYYLDESGAMQTGWVKIGYYWYYLKDSGAMAENETLRIQGVRYSFDASGRWIN